MPRTGRSREDTSAHLPPFPPDTTTLSPTDFLDGRSSTTTRATTATADSAGTGSQGALSPSQNKRPQGKVSSCVECRRLKLKCTRANNTNRWPCNQCVRRKCGDICPGGTSTPTTKAGNETLLRHYRKRIADLEAKLTSVTGGGEADRSGATAAADSTARSNDGMGQQPSDAPRSNERRHFSPRTPAHPPFSAQPAAVLSQQGHAEPVNFGGPADPSLRSARTNAPLPALASQQTSYHEAPRHFEESSRRPETASTGNASNRGATSFSSTGPAYYGKNAGVLYSQPDSQDTFGTSALAVPHSSQEQALAVLPRELADAQVLLHQYATQVAWMYTPVDVRLLEETLVDLYQGDTLLTEARLTMILLALALGALFSPSPSARGGSQTPQSHLLAPTLFGLGFRLFLSQGSALGVFTPGTWETAVCAHLAVSYLLSRGQADASHAAWQVLGNGIRTALSLGLHCNQSSWSVSAQKAHANARVYWELHVYECLQSLNFGRPAVVPEYVGCPAPFQIPPLDLSGAPPLISPHPDVFHAMKYQLCPLYNKINLLHSKEELPEIHQVMAIDEAVRQFAKSVPSWLQLSLDWPAAGDEGLGATRPEDAGIPEHHLEHIVPQRHMLSLLIHKALLFLHRPFFAHTIQQSKGEPLLSLHASSFAAAIGSARQHTLLVRSLVTQCPQALKWWFFIFHLYTAAIIQAQVLLRAPGSMLATEVQSDLEISFSILNKAAASSPIAEKAVIHVASLRNKILRKLAARSAAIGTHPYQHQFQHQDQYQRPQQDHSAHLSHASTSSVAGSHSGANVLVGRHLPTKSGESGLHTLSRVALGGFELTTSSSADTAASSNNHSAASPFNYRPPSTWGSSATCFEPSISSEDAPTVEDTVMSLSSGGGILSSRELDDLSAILENDMLEGDILGFSSSGAPPQWSHMDPLLQTTLFWHTDAPTALLPETTLPQL